MSLIKTPTVNRHPKSIKKQSILSKLLTLHTAYTALKRQNRILQKQNERLQTHNTALLESLKVMETQMLQLREIVTLQARDNMFLMKELGKENMIQKT